MSFSVLCGETTYAKSESTKSFELKGSRSPAFSPTPSNVPQAQLPGNGNHYPPLAVPSV